MLISALQDDAKEFHRDKNRTIDLIAKEYNLSKDARWWFDFKYSRDGKILLIDADAIPKHIYIHCQ